MTKLLAKSVICRVIATLPTSWWPAAARLARVCWPGGRGA